MHMKKSVLLLSSALLIGNGVAAFAQSDAQADKKEPASIQADMNAGVVTQLDTAGKMLTLKTAAKDGAGASAEGKVVTIYWDDATKVEGTLKEGEHVQVRSIEKSGKAVATWIRVGKANTTKPQGM